MTSGIPQFDPNNDGENLCMEVPEILRTIFSETSRTDRKWNHQLNLYCRHQHGCSFPSNEKLQAPNPGITGILPFLAQRQNCASVLLWVDWGLEVLQFCKLGIQELGQRVSLYDSFVSLGQLGKCCAVGGNFCPLTKGLLPNHFYTRILSKP